MDQIDHINATLILLTPRDAKVILGRIMDAQRQVEERRVTSKGPSLSSRTCVHIQNPLSALASDREPCGYPVRPDGPSGWLCWRHDAQVFSAGGK